MYPLFALAFPMVMLRLNSQSRILDYSFKTQPFLWNFVPVAGLKTIPLRLHSFLPDINPSDRNEAQAYGVRKLHR
jgi:hypothetical protein